MKRLLVLSMLAGAMSSQAFGAVVDRFKCHVTLKDNVTGVDSRQEVTLDSLRSAVAKPEVWSPDANVRLYRGGTFTDAALSGQGGRNLASIQVSYHVAEKYDANGQLLAAKFSPYNHLGVAYCFNGELCLRPVELIPFPLIDPFLKPSVPGWKDLQIHNGLSVLNAEDFQDMSSNGRDDQGRFNFDATGGCVFKASIMPAPGT